MIFCLRALAIFLPLHYTLANPLLSSRDALALFRRANPCEAGGTPILYKDYGSDACPPKNTMDGQGECPYGSANDCIAYCEVRQTFTYDVEQPLDNSYCHGPETCTVGSNKATTYTYSGNINLKWLDALGIGITGGYSSATATTDVRSTSVKLDEGSCGYFTFLPILHASWYVHISLNWENSSFSPPWPTPNPSRK